jgi:predicted dehydrogenase
VVTNSPEREATIDVVDRQPGSKVAAIDVIGAGNFAKTMLLPHLKGEHDLGVIVNATALSSRHVKEKFGFEKAETDSEEVFKMPDERAVVIGTRHHLHAPLVLKGLAANRHVFVEKPLCLLRSEMVEIDSAYKDSQGTVMIGFNRRFAPATTKVKNLVVAAPGPAVCAFHVCAGKLDPEHWYANYEESGGRVLGEACHFFDFFCHLFDSKPVGVTAQPTWSTGGAKTFPDSISAQVEFEDGSCGQLIYSAEGDSSYPKEVFTVYAAGLTARCENFQSLSIHRGRKESKSKYTSKGHQEEMMAWSAFLKGNAAHPLPYHTGRQSMELTFAALDSIRENRTIILA